MPHIFDQFGVLLFFPDFCGHYFVSCKSVINGSSPFCGFVSCSLLIALLQHMVHTVYYSHFKHQIQFASAVLTTSSQLLK